jgi:hypothetical protein
MGWAISVALTILGLIKQDSLMVIAASIFALTGAVSAVVVTLKKD